MQIACISPATQAGEHDAGGVRFEDVVHCCRANPVAVSPADLLVFVTVLAWLHPFVESEASINPATVGWGRGYGTSLVTFPVPLLAVHMLVPSNPIPAGLVAPVGSAKLTPAPLSGLIRVTFAVP